jgi:hypothetical protein
MRWDALSSARRSRAENTITHRFLSTYIKGTFKNQIRKVLVGTFKAKIRFFNVFIMKNLIFRGAINILLPVYLEEYDAE